MKKYAAIALIVLLTGCAAQVVSTSDRTVIVQARVQDAAGAQGLASAECQKHGLKARLAGKLSLNQYVFDCVS